MEFTQEVTATWFGILGGLSAMITAFLYANQKARFSTFSNDLDATRDTLKRVLDSEVHAKKKIFDKEFAIYEDLWDLITDLEKETHEMLSLNRIDRETPEDMRAKVELKLRYIEFYKDVNYRVRKYAPFIPVELYEEINSKFDSSKWSMESIEMQSDEVEYLRTLDEDIGMIRNRIALRMGEYSKTINH